VCTLTLVPGSSGNARLAFNRDESRSRPAAYPPQRRRFGERTAILPIDPVSDGTWIAVNDAGLVLALLNVNPSVSEAAPRAALRGQGRRSRGAIIPELLPCGTLGEVLERMAELPVRGYAPFRLVLFGAGEVAEVRPDGEQSWRRRPESLAGPRLWTSSGLGDHLVEGRRRQLFEAYFARPGHRAARQDAFHRHRWPADPHLSVCMRRADACTVSYTVVELDSSSARMTYFPAAPDQLVQPEMARLLFVSVGAR
jgi:hypothetical protein